MKFADAVRTCLTQYATFEGRARRSEYWWFVAFAFAVSVVTNVIDAALGTSVVQGIAVLALLLPAVAVGVRRLHDTGRSGWFMLLPLLPFVGGLVLLFFAVQDSDPGPNAYGPSPKGTSPFYDPAVR